MRAMSSSRSVVKFFVAYFNVISAVKTYLSFSLSFCFKL